MKLINAKTRQIEEFLDHRNAPPYAILSHRWETEEVSYADIMANPNVESMAGYRKIRLCCAQACADNLSYAWVDTCCIDKTSSAELSEAINSMFAWYRDSQVCYVYLSDVDWSDSSELPLSETVHTFRASQWFTRGWTLQELLAPRNEWFFDKNWRVIGTRGSATNSPNRLEYRRRGNLEMRQQVALDTTLTTIPILPLSPQVECPVLLSEIINVTGIDEEAFRVEEYSRFSVAQRMSWASRRRTSRLEDEAYCLIGLFDVNMPLIYGEGSKAFQRLQEEIMRASTDQSIFAWVWDDSKESEQSGQISATDLLASSPRDFVYCRDVHRLHGLPETQKEYQLTNRGLTISAPLEAGKGHQYMWLNCHERGYRIALRLSPLSDDSFVCYRTASKLPLDRDGSGVPMWNQDMHDPRIRTVTLLRRLTLDTTLSGSVHVSFGQKKHLIVDPRVHTGDLTTYWDSRNRSFKRSEKLLPGDIILFCAGLSFRLQLLPGCLFYVLFRVDCADEPHQPSLKLAVLQELESNSDPSKLVEAIKAFRMDWARFSNDWGPPWETASTVDSERVECSAALPQPRNLDRNISLHVTLSRLMLSRVRLSPVVSRLVGIFSLIIHVVESNAA